MYRMIAASLALWTGCAAGTPTWQQQPSRNRPVRHVMVQFTDTTLHPTTAQLLAGGTVSWVNYASLYDGSIVFPPATVAGFTCSDLRPDWGKTADGAQSIPITMGAAANDLEIPCPLAPGSYDYEVWLFSPGVGDPSGLDEPEARMQGRIVVE